MKDYDVLNEVWEQEVLEDFDGFLAAEKWSDCVAIIGMLGDRGFENTAVRLNHVLNAAKAAGYVEPVSQENIHDLMPEEDDAPELAGVFPDLNRDERFLNANEI